MSKSRERARRRNPPKPAKPPEAAASEEQTASRLPRWMQARWVPLVALLLLVGTVLTVTMPSMIYPGDRNASRMQAINVVTKGELGIPYTDRAMLGGFLDERGQYFFENDEKERIYSKYGIGYTLFQIPPLLVIKQLSPGLSITNTPSTLSTSAPFNYSAGQPNRATSKSSSSIPSTARSKASTNSKTSSASKTSPPASPQPSATNQKPTSPKPNPLSNPNSPLRN